MSKDIKAQIRELEAKKAKKAKLQSTKARLDRLANILFLALWPVSAISIWVHPTIIGCVFFVGTPLWIIAIRLTELRNE